MNSELRQVRLYETPVPLGASIAASAFTAAYRFVAKLFSGAPKQPMSRIEEAEEVRAMARSVAATDPGFANDLFAAADRHEAIR